MNETTVTWVAILVLGWATVSGVLTRHSVTGPLVFTLAGYVLGNPTWGLLTINAETASIHVLAELTLALVLFSDASQIDISDLKRDLSVPMRLLGIGLPLTMILGGVLAAVFLGEMTWALAGFVGAALAATDAALSAQVISDERVPERLRRDLNVESGLNDGIATPFVTLALAVAASQMGVEAETETAAAGMALRELGLGAVVGLVVGWLAAFTIGFSARRDWTDARSSQIASLAAALGAFALAVAVDANGFIAAFIAGLAFAAVLDKQTVELEEAVHLPEISGHLLGLIVWFIFGATLVPAALEHLSWSVVAYALLSLTVIRMVPVAIAMTRSGIDRKGVLFLGWFGPRGLASVVFALLALERLGEGASEAVAVVAMTVLFSVVLHGVTAAPAARRYGPSPALRLGRN